MTVNEINNKAYEFIGKVRQLKRVTPKSKDTGSLEQVPCQDISNYEIIETPSFERAQGHDNKDFHIVLNINEKIFGFEKAVYPKFFSLIDEIFNLKEVKNAVTYKFVEEKTLIWIVGVFQNKKSSTELINFLEDKIAEATEERLYYFPILNLHIDKQFEIGDIAITYLDKKFFDDLWEKYNYKEKYSVEDFDKNLRKYQGQVSASVKVKAEYEKGKLVAFDKCSLAIDVLKMYTPTVIFPNRECLLDLAEKINLNYKSDILSYIVNCPNKLIVTTSMKADPLFVSDDVLDFFNKNGINIFSTFLLKYDKKMNCKDF